MASTSRRTSTLEGGLHIWLLELVLVLELVLELVHHREGWTIYATRTWKKFYHNSVCDKYLHCICICEYQSKYSYLYLFYPFIVIPNTFVFVFPFSLNQISSYLYLLFLKLIARNIFVFIFVNKIINHIFFSSFLVNLAPKIVYYGTNMQ